MRLVTDKTLFLLLLAIAAILGGASNGAQAQVAKKPKYPPPEDVTLETTDGMNIRATWYQGLAKKESVPIIMVHGFDGSRGEYDALARALQTLGHSSIVPDLRGHGDSKTLKLASGDTKTIEASAMRPRDMESMTLDLEACKKFLMEKNNAGECNIEMLCLIGAEFGSVLTLRYAALDWSVPNLPAFKQGQDVKGVILLSPTQAEKGLTTREALAHPALRSRISVMLVAGKEDSDSTRDAKRLQQTFQGSRPKLPSDPEEAKAKQDLFLVQPETKLKGTKLLSQGLPVAQQIARFLDLRFVKKKAEYAWSERKNPLGN